MAFKLSIIGFAALAFLGPVVLFVTAVLVYRRVKQHREENSIGLHLGEADTHWPVALKQKSNPSKIPNLADVPLKIVGAKRPASSLSTNSSRIAVAVGPPSNSSSSSSSRSTSPAISPAYSTDAPVLLAPPPAAGSPPDSYAINMASAATMPCQPLQQQGQQASQTQHADASAAVHLSPQLAEQAQAHCVLEVPMVQTAGQQAQVQGVACH